jgi:hypothetical protein
MSTKILPKMLCITIKALPILFLSCLRVLPKTTGRISCSDISLLFQLVDQETRAGSLNFKIFIFELQQRAHSPSRFIPICLDLSGLQGIFKRWTYVGMG